jgi:hypothetical protein
MESLTTVCCLESKVKPIKGILGEVSSYLTLMGAVQRAITTTLAIQEKTPFGVHAPGS